MTATILKNDFELKKRRADALIDAMFDDLATERLAGHWKACRQRQKQIDEAVRAKNEALKRLREEL